MLMDKPEQEILCSTVMSEMGDLGMRGFGFKTNGSILHLMH